VASGSREAAGASDRGRGEASGGERQQGGGGGAQATGPTDSPSAFSPLAAGGGGFGPETGPSVRVSGAGVGGRRLTTPRQDSASAFRGQIAPYGADA
jgi:hypothetical protein